MSLIIASASLTSLLSTGSVVIEKSQ